MGTVLVDQSSNVWSFSATGGAETLPITICAYDLIPKRLRWVSPAATAGDQVIIKDAQGNVCYEEGPANGAEFDPVEQRPREHEKWIGYFNPAGSNGTPGPPASGYSGITLTQLSSGILYIYV